jgi:hypothetical protein
MHCSDTSLHINLIAKYATQGRGPITEDGYFEIGLAETTIFHG